MREGHATCRQPVHIGRLCLLMAQIAHPVAQIIDGDEQDVRLGRLLGRCGERENGSEQKCQDREQFSVEYPTRLSMRREVTLDRCVPGDNYCLEAGGKSMPGSLFTAPLANQGLEFALFGLREPGEQALAVGLVADFAAAVAAERGFTKGRANLDDQRLRGSVAARQIAEFV